VSLKKPTEFFGKNNNKKEEVTINQNNGTITGRAFTRSLFNQMTPFILALS